MLRVASKLAAYLSAHVLCEQPMYNRKMPAKLNKGCVTIRGPQGIGQPHGRVTRAHAPVALELPGAFWGQSTQSRGGDTLFRATSIKSLFCKSLAACLLALRELGVPPMLTRKW